MRRCSAHLGWLLLALPLAAASHVDPAWRAWLSPQAMARIDASSVSVERSSFCSENCRYDRSGQGDELPADNPRPDRWLYRDGPDFVLYDDPGSGVLTRLWMATGGPQPACFNPGMQLKLYFGESSTPQLQLPLAAVFDNSTPPFTAPLVFDKDAGSGGYASYVPIAYRQGLRVAVTGLDQPGPCSGNEPPRLWYQLDAQHLPPGAIDADFSPTETQAELRAFLAAEGDDPWQRGLASNPVSNNIAPGQNLELLNATGSGWLAGIRLQLDSPAWEQLRLVVDVDGATLLSLPLSRAFAVDAADDVPARAPLFGHDAQGWLYLWWPVPYRQQLSVRLDGSELAQAVTVQSRVILDPTPVPADAGGLAVVTQQQCGLGGDHQLELAGLEGRGRLMALTGSYGVAGGGSAVYLEGDTRLRMDKTVAPAWQGSGLEDFFNGGFYFDWGRAWRQPWSGAGRVEVTGVSRMWRVLLADAPAFANGLQLLQEAGASPAEPAELCADTVTWLYHSPERALVPVARLEVGKPADRLRHDHQLPPKASCQSVNSAFADAAATPRAATSCRYTTGSEHFHVRLPNPSGLLRLRRTVDAAQAGQAARIEVNGATAGWFPPVRPDPVRRWQTQDAPLAVAAGTTDLAITAVPLWGGHGDTGSFGTSAWELWAELGDTIFQSGFDVIQP